VGLDYISDVSVIWVCFVMNISQRS